MFDEKFSERLDILVEKLGGKGKACRSVDIAYPTLDRWKKRTSEPLMIKLSEMARAGDVSLDWLIYGSETENKAKAPEHTDTGVGTEYIYVPFYYVEASAGHGAYVDEQAKPIHRLAFRKRWAEARNFDVKQLVGLIARGDSMIPTIPEGAAIIINKTVKQALDGRVHVIRIGERLWVKRTQWTPTGGLRLISDNKTYDTFEISLNDLEHGDIEVIGEVVHVAHDLD